MNPANVLRVLAWLARDTFRQSVESRVCWFMLALSVVAITICLSVSVQGGAGLQRDGERPDFLPRDDPDAATSQALLKREGVDVPSGDLTIAFGAFRVPLGRDARDAVQFLQFILAGGLASTAGLFLSLVWTAGFLPAFLAPRSITLLLARPVPRSLLYLGKVLGVVLFVVAQATLLVVGTWLALGLRTGVWDGAYLWCLPLLVVEFMVFYSVSALIASHARGVVACVLGSLLFWVVCWGMNFGRHALVALPEIAPNVAQTARPLGWAVEAGYWLLPKPADFRIILADAMECHQRFATVPEFEAVKHAQRFHPTMALVTSVVMACFLFTWAARRFETADL